MAEEKDIGQNGVGVAASLVSEEEGGDSAQEEAVESRIYEVGYLLAPTISEEDLPREVTSLKDILEKEKATVIADEFPKFRPLAYEMRRTISGKHEDFNNAYFGWVKFETGSASARRIEEELKRNEKVIRFLLIRTVREQTISAGRAPQRPRRTKTEAPKDAAPSAPVSETELEKSIEKLIAE